MISERQIETEDGVLLRYLETGPAPTETVGAALPPLIFIPGWTMSADVFIRQLVFFGQHRRVLAVDPRGQGKSAKPPQGYTYERRILDLAAMINCCREKPVVISWSAGVFDHLAYVQQRGTDRIAGHVLIDGAPATLRQSSVHDQMPGDHAWGNQASGDRASTDWAWFKIDDPQARWFVDGPLGDRRGFDLAFAGWMLERPTPRAVAWLCSLSAQTPDWVAAITNAVSLFADYRLVLSQLSAKADCLIVVRAEWRDVAADWIAHHAPASGFAGFGSHLMFWEQADEFNRLLDSFLARLPGTQPQERRTTQVR
jgi:non-heme chloroperoxidase